MTADHPTAPASPLVSVVIPAYNAERFIEGVLASVFAQTFHNYEVVVVDDGSTDRTADVVAAHGARVRLLQQANAGQSAARNRGAREARGLFLAFLDHDDRFEPDHLAAVLAEFDAHPDCGLIAPGLRFMSADGAPTPRTVTKRTPGLEYSTVSLLEGDVGTIVNPVVRRAVFLAAGGYDPAIKGPEDCDLWLRLSFITTMRHLPRPLYLYRVHPQNYSKDILGNARAWLRLLEKFEREHPDFARDHAALVQRNIAKQKLRLGRELIRHAASEPNAIREARATLREAIRANPRKGRAYLYAALAHAPGVARLYAGFRRREVAWRDRLLKSRLLAALKKT